jgi:hypothetical protein
MSQSIFARAIPSKINVTETYRYHAIIASNSVTDEKGEPEGEIEVEIPYDGYQHFTRLALSDVKKQHRGGSGDLYATIGHLAASEIESKVFWGNKDVYPPRQVLPISVPLPGDRDRLNILIEDQQKAVYKYQYFPKWPDVFPRPRPISLDIDILDEQIIRSGFRRLLAQDTTSAIEELLVSTQWDDIVRELSFERMLYFLFYVELALPKRLGLAESPELSLMRLEWPVATSYRMLTLQIEEIEENEENEDVEEPEEIEEIDQNDNSNGYEDTIDDEISEDENDYKSVHENVLLYDPERENVAWHKISFIEGSYTPESETTQHLSFYQAPLISLYVFEPGELYHKDRLVCRTEIELPGILLSGMELTYFNATGEPLESVEIKKRTRIIVDTEIVLEDRFNNKTISPIRQLQFEGVILEERRMGDIAVLLKDMGFEVSTAVDLSIDRSQPEFALMAIKFEGPDDMLLWVHARGTLGVTERETVIPGGKTYKTMVESGNMSLDLRAELRGNVQKLTSALDTIHILLKDRFRHVSTLE